MLMTLVAYARGQVVFEGGTLNWTDGQHFRAILKFYCHIADNQRQLACAHHNDA